MTLDEKLAEMSTRPRVIPATPQDLEEIRTIHSEVQVTAAALVVENAALKLKIKELEEEQPQPTPPGNPPKILNERFINGVDWHRFFAEEGDDANDRAKFTQTPDGLKVMWMAGSSSKRTELGIRVVPGGGGTPRRDPIGSERWYGLEFMVPDAYKLDDGTADAKRVLWQCHQSGPGITNPPVSLELRNGTFRLVRSVGDEREHHLNPTGDPPGIPCAKGVWHKLVVHMLWHATAGYVECWLDTLHVPKATRKTCTASGDGLNCKTGSYQPGHTSFPSGYRLEHLIRRWSIGDESNTREDME